MILLQNCDCNRYSPWFKDGFFDLTVADPPYFSGPEKLGYYRSESVSSTKVKRKKYEITDSWDLPENEWFEEIQRVSKNQIIWGANYFSFIEPPFKTPKYEDLEEFLNTHPTGWIVWDKCNRHSNFNDFELAWTSFVRPTKVYRFMWNGMNQGKSMLEGHIMQGNKKLNQKRIHPTEKPILLYDWIFDNYTEAGHKIYSPYGGSFSDAISASKFDIEFYGLEINKPMFDKAFKRFKLHSNQQVLNLA